MLQFKPVTQQDAPRLRRYYQGCDYGLCEYSVGTKLMWRPVLHPAWTEVAGCLVVRNRSDGRYVFDYPVPGPEGDVDKALTLIEEWCTENGCRLQPGDFGRQHAPQEEKSQKTIQALRAGKGAEHHVITKRFVILFQSAKRRSTTNRHAVCTADSGQT